MQLTNEFEPIRNWASERGIYDKGDIKTQFIKLQEESGELAQAILKNDLPGFKDAVGDCVVVLTNLVELANKHFVKEYYEDVVGDGGPQMLQFEDNDMTIEECINEAFSIIKHRSGKMSNGTFVKNTD